MILLKNKNNYSSLKKFFLKKKINLKKISFYEKKNIVKNIQNKIFKNNFSSVISKKRLNAWNSAWSNPVRCKNIYLPNYYSSKKNIFRISGNYYYSTTRFSAYYILQFILEDVFQKFKKLVGKARKIDNFNILEFGSGSGSNLIFLKKRKIIKNHLLAFDWSDSSLDLIKKNAKKNNITIQTYKFNIIKPKFIKINESPDIILTCYSLEQVNRYYKNFFKYLKKIKPKYIINIEPIMEHYNKKSYFDLIAYKYHIKRKYLYKYKTYLKSLERKNLIKILSDYKYYFGNKYDDSSSVLIWKFK